MTLHEYEAFYDYSSNHHANELMNIFFGEALREAKIELNEMLPDGWNTKNQSDSKFVGFCGTYLNAEIALCQQNEHRCTEMLF